MSRMSPKLYIWVVNSVTVHVLKGKVHIEQKHFEMQKCLKLANIEQKSTAESKAIK